MKSNGVGAATNVFALFSGGVEAVGGDGGGEGFDFMLSQKTAPVVSGMDMVSADLAQAGGMAPQHSYEKEIGGSGYRDFGKVDDPFAKGLPEELRGAYGVLKDKVQKAIADELGITEEELEEAMAQMGITFEQLLQGDGLKELMMGIMGIEDATELLFSDAFQSLSDKIGELLDGFLQQSGLSADEWQAMLEQMAEAELPDQAGAELPSQAEAESSGTQSLAQAEDDVLSAQGQAKDSQPTGMIEVVRPEQAQASVEETSAEGQQGQQALSEGLTGDGAQAREDAADADGQADFLDSALSDDTLQQEKPATSELHPQQATFQQAQANLQPVGEGAAVAATQPMVDVQDIMSQIAEYTRITVQEAQSSIEMQLNPEHLGKIYLQVATKDGIITAQIAAQNEAVKQALETQVTVLKENMNQQGLKVEAVEVTIASHEFEQNLDGQSRQTEGEAEADAQQGRGGRRNLQLGQLEEFADSMTDEESLMAQIMLENGNSMDLTA